MKDIHDVIKHAKFGDDRLRGSGVVAGQISAFPIDFAGRHYNTLTLPCERVIQCIRDALAHVEPVAPSDYELSQSIQHTLNSLIICALLASHRQ